MTSGISALACPAGRGPAEGRTPTLLQTILFSLSIFYCYVLRNLSGWHERGISGVSRLLKVILVFFKAR